MTFNFISVNASDIDDQIRNEWDLLINSNTSNNFYHNWRWLLPLMNTLLPRMHIVLGYRNQELILIMPLQYDKKERKLSLPYCLDHHIVDCVIATDVQCPALCKALMSFINQTHPKWLILENPRLLSNSYYVSIFNHLNGFRHLDAFAKNSFFLVTENETYRPSESQLKHAKRHQRKLEKAYNTISFSATHANKADIQQFFELEKSSWKGNQYHQSALAHTPMANKFYTTMVDYFSLQQKIRVFQLKTKNEVISSTFGILSNQTLYLLKTAYLPTYAKYSPGNILLLHILEHAQEHPEINEINLITGPSWADRWAPLSNPVYWATLYRKNLMGSCRYAFHQFKDWIRPIKEVCFNKGSLNFKNQLFK